MSEEKPKRMEIVIPPMGMRELPFKVQRKTRAPELKKVKMPSQQKLILMPTQNKA